MQEKKYLIVYVTVIAISGLFLFANTAFAEEAAKNPSPNINVAGSQPVAGNPPVQEVTVTGRSEDLLGVAGSASQGDVGPEELEIRPYLRPAEVLETVPGLVISQHSGPGKANQYYLRGFNLDHGTDFATSFDGMPINLPAHAHGQGYTDLNFLMPELVDEINYRKGTYYADQGDFSATGAANIQLKNSLPQGFAKFTVGTDGYGRTLVTDSKKMGDGNILAAVEAEGYNGPFTNTEDERKLNALLHYSEGNQANGYDITAMAYHNKFNSTDQVPERAVSEGLISRWGSIDPTDGGDTQRYSLSGNWQQTESTTADKLSAYIYYYDLSLFSNFTYDLNNTVTGDQMEQYDRRLVAGGSGSHQWATDWLGKDITNTVGFQLRNDYIPASNLYRTQGRNITSTVVNDKVDQASTGIYGQSEIQWLPKFRTTLGLRGDAYNFNVDSQLAQNSGNVTAAILSPKFQGVIGPWAKTEFYFDAGQGFHSNDARGTTFKVDPNNGVTPQSPVTPLVKANGAEVGIRSNIIPKLNSTLSLWILDLKSELTFDGDAGQTSAGRPSRRSGIEFTNFYQATSWLTLDADLAASKAHFTDSDDGSLDTEPGHPGNYIPGSIDTVFTSGATVTLPSGFYGSIRSRYFGPRPLIEDNSVRSKSTILFNADSGYRYENIEISLELLNIFNRNASDIDYFYASRLPGEPAAGIYDTVFHPAEPFEARLSLTVYF